MSPAKKQQPSSIITAFSSWLLGAGRPLLVLAVLIAVFGGGAYLLWVRLGPRILRSPGYRIGPESVEITPLPSWIHRKDGEFQAEVFRDPALDGPLSLMDDDLTKRIANAFAQHPWVAKVRSVTKRYPHWVGVDLLYRQPVCMVEVSDGELLPVDAEAVLLPNTSQDFSPNEAAQYPRLVGIERPPTVPPGKPWSDAKIIGGAEIAAALGAVWENMKLHRIVALQAVGTSSSENVSSRRAMEPLFALVTRGGTQIMWGYAPGARNVSGELPAGEKIARLKRYFDDNDTLDGPQGQPQQLDVRTLGTGMEK